MPKHFAWGQESFLKIPGVARQDLDQALIMDAILEGHMATFSHDFRQQPVSAAGT